MEHFVTLFDSSFLPQGLALHMSMERHITNYTLWILCVDDAVHENLIKFALPNVRLLKLTHLETAELLKVKPGRTKGEYCWTLTPFAPRFVFEADASVQRVTYLDADMWFRKNPTSIFAEFEASGKHVMITDHNYAPEYDQSATSGQYCVQFMTFTRDGGEVVRKWWEHRCIEWCFARYEDGKFGDQKYLDEWPQIFANYVHVLQNKEALLAPWNATRFPYGNSVAWHFHQLRLIVWVGGAVFVDYGPYPLPANVQRHIYSSYLSDLSDAVLLMKKYKIALVNQKRLAFKTYLKIRVSTLYRNLWRLNAPLIAKLF